MAGPQRSERRRLHGDADRYRDEHDGTPIPVGSAPVGIAITPDQAPTAAFSAIAAPTGSASRFDASASASPVGSIASRWDFGDGQTSTTTRPITTHAYAHAGVYTPRLTVTNTAGTSTTQVFTGRTVSKQGGPQATTARTLTVSAPKLSALTVSPRSFSINGPKVGGRCVKRTTSNENDKRCRIPIALAVSYALSANDTVVLTVKRDTFGRTDNGTCVRQTRQNAAGRRATEGHVPDRHLSSKNEFVRKTRRG
jgi:hypothetical protein